MACNYSIKFIPLIVAKGIELENNQEALQQWFEKSFKNGLDIYNRYISGALFNEKSTSDTSIVPNNSYWGRFTLDTEYDSVSDYYKNAAHLQIFAEQKFKQEIVKRVVFDIEEADKTKR